MTPIELLEILKQAGKLKTTMRHCWMKCETSEEDPVGALSAERPEGEEEAGPETAGAGQTDAEEVAGPGTAGAVQQDEEVAGPGASGAEQPGRGKESHPESEKPENIDASSIYRRESVAEHSWRLALMAMLLSCEEEFAALDMNKVIRMCLIHDLGESFTGDIPAFLKNSEDTGTEIDLYREWVKQFPERQRQEWLNLLSEMEALETREAKTYKALDKLEALIAHNESDLSTWLPLEYDLQLIYGQENMKFSPYFTELRKVVDAWTEMKIRKGE